MSVQSKMSKLSQIKADILTLGSPAKAQKSAIFFKTGVGQYGAGDVFVGVTTPELRFIVQQYRDVVLHDIETLLKSKEHEFRSAALMILVDQFERGDKNERKMIYDFYIANATHVNNWDLVDSSAEYIVGAYLYKGSKIVAKKTLLSLAKSENIWERRIAIVSTFAYIKRGESEMTFTIAKVLLRDTHDLIHKAVGWMLREVGKRCGEKIEREFLDDYYSGMPRTMLRYAIERFAPELRKKYMVKISRRSMLK